MLDQYDSALVAMSMCIAIVAAYASLDIVLRAFRARNDAHNHWRIWGPAMIGTGLWSIHVLGSLAMETWFHALHSPLTSLLALLVAFLTGALILHACLRPQARGWELLGSGMAIGVGICSMHYVDCGLMTPMISHDPERAALAVLGAGVGSTIALWAAHRLERDLDGVTWLDKVKTAIVSGSTVAAVHYALASTTSFTRGAVVTEPLGMPEELIGTMLSLFVLVVSGLSIFVSQFESSNERWSERLLHALRDSTRDLSREKRSRMQAEHRARDMEGAVRSTIDSMDAHICVVDTRGRIVAVNAAWREFADGNGTLAPTVSEGVNYLDVCRRGDDAQAQLFADGLQDVLEGRRPSFEMSYSCHAPHEQRWYVANVARISDSGPIQALVTHTNVTDRHVAQDVQRERDTRQWQVFEQSVDGIALLDARRMIVDANDAFCRLVDCPRKSLLALDPEMRNLDRFVGEALRGRWSTLERDGGTVSTTLHRLDGAELSVEIHCSRVDWGERPLVFCALRDVSERARTETLLAQATERYGNVVRQLVDGVVVTDADGRIREINDAASAIFGYAPGEAVGMSVAEWLPRPYRNRRSTVLLQLLRRRRDFEGVRRDGSRFPMELAISEMTLGSQHLYTGIVRDLTERHDHEARVMRLTRMKAISMNVGTLVSRVRNREELFTEACRIGVEQVGFALAWIGVPEDGVLRHVVLQGDAALCARLRAAVARHCPQGTWPMSAAISENRTRTVDDLSRIAAVAPPCAMESLMAECGLNSFIELPLCLAGGAIGSIGLVSRRRAPFDADEIQMLQEVAADLSHAMEFIARREQVEYLTSYDALTQLANRGLFLDRIAAAMVPAREAGQRVAVAMLDVENFKGVNDALGHAGGDAILRLLATRLIAIGGGAVYAARLGGDRFGLWTTVPDPQVDIAKLTQKQVLSALSVPFDWEDRSYRLRVRVGVAVFPGDGEDAAALLLAAEAALKRAKAANERLLFATTELSSSFRQRMRLENQLEAALPRQEFQLQYQPKVDLQDGRVVGCEALLRWHKEGQAPVSPGVFIPVLEQTGLIVEVGQWALAQAARDLTTWREAGHLVRVAVNVSPVQLRQPNFVQSVQTALRELRDALPEFDVEVTESMLMTDVEATIAKLAALRRLGVSIAIDDFGTGYSSLAYLARLPVDTLKIDRSFVVQMPASAPTRAIVGTILNLAHSLNLRVVAEGVDDHAQLELLRAQGCDELQGWLFSRALSAGDFGKMLEDDRRLILPPVGKGMAVSPAASRRIN